MMSFRMSVVDQHSRPILRQSQEGLAISQSIREREEGRKRIILMNSRKEFYQPGIINPSFQPARA